MSLVLLCAAAHSCETPGLTVVGPRPPGFAETREDSARIRSLFPRPYEGWIAWPPRELTRTIDISFDMTGSMFQNHVLNTDGYHTLARHDLRKLNDFLREPDHLRSGDRVVVRVFGANWRGQGIEARSELRLEAPRDSLQVRVNITSRGPEQLVELVIEEYRDAHGRTGSIADSIVSWLGGMLTDSAPREGAYFSSPLLEHVRRVTDSYAGLPDNPVSLVFVTDGLVELQRERLYPDSKDPLTVVERMKTLATAGHLQPFSEARVPANQLSVVFLGLFDGGNRDFALARDQFLRWVFAPQRITLVGY